MKPIHWIISLIWLTSILYVESIPRSAFISLWSYYSISFVAFIWLMFGKQPVPLYHGILLGILCRLGGLFFDPMLSDDYYRYIWDGMVMHQGLNPMTFVPSYLLSHPQIAQMDPDLFARLNSPDYHAVYPPFAQWINYISFTINKLSLQGHILFYKVLLLVSDILIIYLLLKILRQNKLPLTRVFIYALNPLMIIEYTGNLHFESFMIAGLLGAIVLADRRKVNLSSFFMAISIASKMLTLVLIPFMTLPGKFKINIQWMLTTLGLIFIFFWMTFGNHYEWMGSIGLWFRSFEFNASLYYLIREISRMIIGYNAIEWIGPIMGLMTLILIGFVWIYAYRKKDLPWSSAMVYVLTIYLVMTTTVHPWYLGTLLVLSVISFHTYPILWTYLVFLSYSHYSGGNFQEKYILILIEYTLLFVWMGTELTLKKQKSARMTVK